MKYNAPIYLVFDTLELQSKKKMNEMRNVEPEMKVD